MSKFFPFLAFAALGFVAADSLFADNSKPNADLQFVLNGIKSERSLLKSCICRMKGNYSYKSRDETSAEVSEISGDLSYFAAFDEQGQVRFDSSYPGWVEDSSKIKSFSKESGEISFEAKKGAIADKIFRNT